MLSYSAITKVKDRERAEGLGVALEKLNPPPMGVGVFELEDGSGKWEVGAYFHDRPDEISILILENAFKADGFAISEIPETDWVTKVKRELSPVEAGQFFVFGKHEKKEKFFFHVASRLAFVQTRASFRVFPSPATIS